MANYYNGFKGDKWQKVIHVRDFISNNVNPYSGDHSFLMEPTQKTKELWTKCTRLLGQEVEKGGVLDMDTDTVSTITSHGPGYIDSNLEVIVGLQTESPLTRGVNPFGGIRMAMGACKEYGYDLDPSIIEVFTKYRKTHNEGVFNVYTDEMKLLRKTGVLTGLPDAYGRGRIIGDYRRVALYGVNRLVAEKKKDLSSMDQEVMNSDSIQLREEIAEQIKALEELKMMAASYGYDLGRPAADAKEAVQWLYFAYLASVKESNGAAESLGRIDAFLDIYITRDLEAKKITEAEAQELIDQLVIKLRLIRQSRTTAYNELFAGDPNWVTIAIGGAHIDGWSMVTKTSYRILHTLENLGPGPEPNLTVLWLASLPAPFKKYCARISINSSSIQYENDDLMQTYFGDDYGIACCVSAMRMGKDMQYFGARCNLAKALLLTVNGGIDEVTGLKLCPAYYKAGSDPLVFSEVWEAFNKTIAWLAKTYVNAMNIIHFMHDKYAYERIQMALHDTNVRRLMAFGLAGLSVAADSLSAIKYAKVRPIFNDDGLVTDFKTIGSYPNYGNNDDRVDLIAVDLVRMFDEKLKEQEKYRKAESTLSILTITSNVVYGKKTGNTPDGRKKGEAFAPGANPMHNRDTCGALAALNTVAKIPYENAMDGISYTFSITPKGLGKNPEEQDTNLIGLLDGFFAKTGHHLNVNVFDRELLIDAMKHPEKYPQLTIRVSGYAVNFVKLTREHQEEVIKRTIFTNI